MVHIMCESQITGTTTQTNRAYHRRQRTSHVQCDHFVLEDIAASDGLKVLSMYVKSFGYGTSTVVETKGATDTFAMAWGVKMMICLGFSDFILQCDPSLNKWQKV